VFGKVLIANRGEIALRILRTLRELGITAVSVYSDSDRDARFVLEADEAYRIGPPPAGESYLNQPAVIEAAIRSGSQALHPGYGFLAENADFADRVAAAGLTFIGPRPESMRLMGDKIAARKAAMAAGVPVVPGTPGPVRSLDGGKNFVAQHGLPVLVKAGGGGGGRGIRVVDDESNLGAALETASREAKTYFSNPDVYLERFYEGARHIEVQVAGDANGRVVAWGERDCSTQRRRQKLIEETPAPNLAAVDRAELLEAARRLAESAGYMSVGTVEFLYAGLGQFFFLEMNTRIQVEHTITEQVTGLDLIRESVRLASGEPAMTAIEPRGHSIEARINAEDPARGFQPGPGRLEIYREPGGQGVRIDSGVYQGFTIPGDYDSLISKLVVHAPDREQAIAKLLRALRGYHIEGVPSTIPLIYRIVDSAAFRAGEVKTDWLDAHLSEFVGSAQSDPVSGEPAADARAVDVEVNGKRFEVRLFDSAVPKAASVTRTPASARRGSRGSANQIVSPMRGTVLSISKSPGDSVDADERLVVIEAMKMENDVRASHAGRVKAVHVNVGETVETGELLLELEQ